MNRTIKVIIGVACAIVGAYGIFNSVRNSESSGIVIGILLIAAGAVWLYLTLIKFPHLFGRKQNESNSDDSKSDNKADSQKNVDNSVIEKTKDVKLKQIPELNANEVINQYITSDHSFCPESYDYNSYKRAEFSCILKSLTPVPIEEDRSINSKRRVSDGLNLYTRTIPKDTPLESLKDFIVIDTETTGTKPENNKIIEIAAIKFIDFKPVEIFNAYLDPKRKLTEAVKEITGIEDYFLEGCPTFPQIQQSFEDFIRNYNLVMHNARFDLFFLYNSGCRIDCNNQAVYDTLALSKSYLRNENGGKYSSYALESLCWNYDIRPVNAHGASSDALATGLLFNEIVKKRLELKSLA